VNVLNHRLAGKPMPLAHPPKTRLPRADHFPDLYMNRITRPRGVQSPLLLRVRKSPWNQSGFRKSTGIRRKAVNLFHATFCEQSAFTLVLRIRATPAAPQS
jgi:hypothetical protein